jgi:glycosyltransferase involved in cell wall biosynthesis
MVQTLVDGLPLVARDLKIFHVNIRLSRDTRDVGRWRLGKLFVLLGACLQAIALRLRHGPMNFYYVPAPGRRAPLYRDWTVMLLCRPFFSHLILHWHGIGLGAWLTSRATPPERALTHLLLGRAALALVLSPELIADAQALTPKRISVIRNGMADPGELPAVARIPGSPTQILFVGLGSPAKGLFDLLTAVAVANRREAGAFRLVVAGGFANRWDEEAFFSQANLLPENTVRHVGVVNESQKRDLFAAADVVCLPTVHPHEGQPLALIEALAYDLPIITTRWRAIPGMLPTGHVWFVDPARPDQIADALIACRHSPPDPGERRRHFLAHFTRERHLSDLAAALATLK